MSSLLEEAPTINEKSSTSVIVHHIHKRHVPRNVLKSKDNTIRHRCNKTLRRKLKKYKLRHDGKEDQDVLDVSQTLISLLKIKSPQNQTQQNNNDIVDENLPRNYLFKMGRKKQIMKTNDSVESNITMNNSHYDKIDNNGTSSSIKNKDKHQTNAFRLMMDSRNKSIGSNSPGKEKCVDETQEQETIVKKAIKAKRNLVLQKMAEAKGSTKKKELEEYQEQCIKIKMEKRAERLKNMIANNETKVIKIEHKVKTKTIKDSSNVINCVTSKDKTDTNKQKTLSLINIFSDPDKPKSPKSKINKQSKEDEDFLKKLSPSIKKKESMLCYFKKVEKEQPSSPDIENEDCEINNDTIIKVKLSTKSKKKVKKKKLSLNKADLDDKQTLDIEQKENNVIDKETTKHEETKADRRKRKRKSIITNDNGASTNNENSQIARPKRNVKKPIKYINDGDFLSSDDDMQIFTPKKKKHDVNKSNSKVTKLRNIEEVVEENGHQKIDHKLKKIDKHSSERRKEITNPTSKAVKQTKLQKKDIKLAPIFAAKPQVDPAVLEAKNKFLHSGVPEKLKKVKAEQNNKTMQLSLFPTVVHVLQKNTNETLQTLSNIYLDDNDSDTEFTMTYENKFFSSLVDVSKNDATFLNQNILKSDTQSVLQNIKQMYIKFPVFRTYRCLKDKSRGEFKDYSYAELDNSIEVMNGMIDLNNQNPDNLKWTDKYKPMSTKQIIGNFETIKELRKWLVNWTENDTRTKNRGGTHSDSSDFYQSDTDSKDSMKTMNNLLVITGPVGSGKTSSVYAVAAELAVKVLEVNVSSKRTGKIMLQDLQEATQSHKVDRGKSSTENSQKSQEMKSTIPAPVELIKKKGRPKKDISSKHVAAKNECLSQSQPGSQDSLRTLMSLILIDDADVVFEQDDGFCSAILQLIQCSKRPVILITSSTTCQHLQRFLQTAKIISMRPLLPRILGTWLDIMCLADNGLCLPGLGSKFLDYFQGDIRKAINSLEFYMSTQSVHSKVKDIEIESSKYPLIVDDENSCMSWGDHESAEVKFNLENEVWNQLFKQELNISRNKYPLKLYSIWWSIPKFLNLKSNCDLEHGNESDKDKHTERTVPKLNSIAKVFDSVSLADYFSMSESSMDMTSQPWCSVESDSVSENENLYNYNNSQEIMDEISHSLISRSIVEAQRMLDLESNVYLSYPCMAERRERDKIIARHKNLTDYLNPLAILDRKSLALDFWPSCRAICRTEKQKTDNNSKRNNRFCHYLKSINVLCKSDTFDRLSDSLHSDNLT